MLEAFLWIYVDRLVMEIFIIIIVLLLIWFFNSESKSNDIKTAFKTAKEVKDGTNKFLDELNDNLDKLNSELEAKNIEKFKKRLYKLSVRDDMEEQCLNELNKRLGIKDNCDEVTWMVDAFKKAGRYDEISHLVTKKKIKTGFFSSKEEKYVINRKYSKLGK